LDRITGLTGLRARRAEQADSGAFKAAAAVGFDEPKEMQAADDLAGNNRTEASAS
jgi:hypothetical protein